MIITNGRPWCTRDLGGKCARFLTNRARGYAETTAHELWRLYDDLVWAARRWRSGVARVLFVAMNGLALKQFVLFESVFQDDARIQFTVTDSPRGRANRQIVREWCSKRGVRYVRNSRARVMPWDLLVFADHDEMGRFPLNVPKIRIPHGIGTSAPKVGATLGRTLPYQYDPSWVIHQGTPFFARMFEASENDVECALKCNPKLRGIVVAVGHLGADRLLALQSQRPKIRAAKGHTPEDWVVLVQSTHGPESLMEWIGKPLVSQCVKTAGTGICKFVLQTHPNHWTGPYAETHPHGQFLLEQEGRPGITVIHHDEDWAPHMAACDMVITDHSSLSMTYALLGRPILFVDVPGAQLIEGSPLHRLAKVLPKLTSVDALATDIERARREFPREQVAEIARDILSYPGEAATRIQQEVRTLLSLDA